MNVPLHANCIVAIVPCPCLRGKRLVLLTHHHGSTTQVPRRTLYHRISGSSAALENSRSPLYPSEEIWRFSQKDSPAVPYGEILSGYEEDVSSIRDGFTAWVKSDPETILGRIVDVTRAYAAFREAPARKQFRS